MMNRRDTLGTDVASLFDEKAPRWVAKYAEGGALRERLEHWRRALPRDPSSTRSTETTLVRSEASAGGLCQQGCE